MSDPFESPKILLARAQERTGDLEKRVKEFIAKKPYADVVEPDGDSGMQAHKFKLTEKVPNMARADAFEVGNSLRSALDQAIYGAALALNGGRPKHTKFPFGDTAADVENDIKRGCGDVPAEIVNLARGFKPHQGGNDALWALNKMRNTKNHQILAPMLLSTGGASVLRIDYLQTSGPAEIGMHRWDAAKQELTYMRTKIGGAKGNYQFSVAVDVVLDEIPMLSGQPAVAVFHRLCGVVQSIVMSIEAETNRILATRSK